LSPYDVYALRYARSTGPKAQRFHSYAEPDGQDPMGTDFYFWLVPGHNPAVMDRYALVADECADLARPR